MSFDIYGNGVDMLTFRQQGTHVQRSGECVGREEGERFAVEILNRLNGTFPTHRENTLSLT